MMISVLPFFFFRAAADGILDLLKALQPILPSLGPGLLQFRWKAGLHFERHRHVQQKLRGRPGQQLRGRLLGFAHHTF